MITYTESCELLRLDPNVDQHTQQDIEKHYKKGMLSYHPDRRHSEDPIIVRAEYDNFVNAKKVVEMGRPPDNTQSYKRYFMKQVSQINENGGLTEFLKTVVIISNAVSDDIVDGLKKQYKTDIQTISCDITAFDYFSDIKTCIETDVAVEGVKELVRLYYNANPDNTSQTFPGVGHKNFDELRGDITCVANVVNSPDEMIEYNAEENQIILKKEIKPPKKIRKSNKPVKHKSQYFFLPSNEILIHKYENAPENIKENTLYDLGMHPKYQDIAIYCKYIFQKSS